MTDRAEVLTFSERPEVGLELLAAARRLADASGGGRVASLVLGQEGAARTDEEIAHGADSVIVASRELPAPSDPSVLLDTLAGVVRVAQPAIVLLGSTLVGAELTARLGQRLGVASASECLELELDAAGDLIVERFVYGGRFVTRRVLHSVPKIAAVQLKRFEPIPADPGRHGDIRELQVPAAAPRVTVLERRAPERSAVDIGKAEVIVSAGRGLKSKDDLSLLESLARALGGGEVAGSRPLVEMQWIARDRQVGLSGEKVKPRLYVACGVSGQIEHIAGMRFSRIVVAINTNPEAPIHHEADYSVTRDLYEFIPALVATLEHRSRAAAGGARTGDSDPAGEPDRPAAGRALESA